MVSRKRTTWRGPAWFLVALGTSVGVSACSLVLDWDPEGLPCGANNDCADTYSCMVNKCVGDGSIAEGDTCSQEQQCKNAPDVTCGSNLFTCRRRCTAPFGTNSVCHSGEFCRPEVNRGTVGQASGTCVKSECKVDNDCDLDVACVAITSSASSCMQLCEYDFDLLNAYTDRCGGSTGGQQYCQPVGLRVNQTFVCLDLPDDASRQDSGNPCDPLVSPCKIGGACVIDDKCYTLCDIGISPSPQCSPTEVCCPLPNSTVDFVCRSGTC